MFLLSFLLYFGLTSAQSAASLTSSGQVNALVFDEVATSSAFVNRAQFYNAFINAKHSFPFPDNTTTLDIHQYPLFINSAILLANITSTQELAMFYAQVLYETNGLAYRIVPPCSALGDCTTCKNYTEKFVNNTGGVPKRNYYGRGHLMIQDVQEYQSASQDLFNDTRLLNHPDTLVSSLEAAWATAAWKWNTKIRPLISGSDAFGLTTKYLRHMDCAVRMDQSQTTAAETAFHIYTAVLQVFAPNATANAAGCYI